MHRHGRAGAAFRVTATLLLLALLVHLARAVDFRALLSRLGLFDVVSVLLLFLLIHFCGMLKWRLLARAAGAPILFLFAARCYAAGLFGNIFLPSNIGGDMISTTMAMRRSPNKVGTVMATVASRLLDFAALLLIIAAGLAYPSNWSLLSAKLLASVSMPAIALVIAGRSFRLRRLLVRIRGVFRAMSRRPLLFAFCFGMSMVLQTGILLLNYWVAILCNLHVPLAAWVFAWPIAKLIAFVPISQGGFGTREFAMAGLLTPFSIPAELVIAVGLVWDVILVLVGLVGGALSLLLARFSRPF